MINKSNILLIWLIGILGTLLFLWVSAAWGIAIHSDTLEYMCLAKYFSTGDVGYVYGRSALQLNMYYLPLFPFFLSLIDRLSIDCFEGLRWFNAVLFGLNIVLVGLILIKYTQKFWLAIGSAAMMVLSTDVFASSASAMSEPLYIFFLLLFLYLFFNYLQEHNWSGLLLAAFVASMAAITRYAGIPLIATAIVGIGFCKNSSVEKIKHMAAFSLISLLPFFSWYLLKNFLYSESMSRSLTLMVHQPITPDYFHNSAIIFCDWLLPFMPSYTFSQAFLAIGLMGLVLFGFIQRPRNTTSVKNDTNYLFLLITYMLFYIIGLVLTLLFFDAYVEPSQRTFLPVYVVGLISLGFWGQTCPFKNKAAGVFLLYLIFISVVKLMPYLIFFHSQGEGYASKQWRESSTLGHLKRFSASLPVYTNELTPVYIFREGPVFEIPQLMIPLLNKPNEQYLQDLAQMIKNLKNAKGLLVYFDNGATNMFFEPIEKIKQELPLQLIGHYSDGQIYKVK